MMFTLFLILHENEEKYRSFRRNVQDNVFAVGDDDDDDDDDEHWIYG